MWDEDTQLQWTPNAPRSGSRGMGFCRDGVHFYWLGRAFVQSNPVHNGQLTADTRFKQTINGMRQVPEHSKTDGARWGEVPGSIFDIDDGYGREALDLEMTKLFRSLTEI